MFHTEFGCGSFLSCLKLSQQIFGCIVFGFVTTNQWLQDFQWKGVNAPIPMFIYRINGAN